MHRRGVIAFPEEATPLLPDLYRLWFDQLWDNVPSVRDNTAAALGNAVRAYGAPALEKVADLVKIMLGKVRLAHHRCNWPGRGRGGDGALAAGLALPQCALACLLGHLPTL